MSAVLKFFGAGVEAPLAIARLKALLIGVLVMLVLCLALAVWALIERSGRLEAKVATVSLRDQVTVCGAALKRQNDSIKELGIAGAEIREVTKGLMSAARQASAAQVKLADHARKIAQSPTPTRLDGTPKGCDDAWREIREPRP